MTPPAAKKKARNSTAEAKRKNADLQRDFRKRRDAYKTELERAVGTLRDTVAQLQSHAEGSQIEIDDLQSKLAQRDAQLQEQTRKFLDADAQLLDLRRRIAAHEGQPLSLGAPPVSMPTPPPSLLGSPFTSFERTHTRSSPPPAHHQLDAATSFVRHGPVMHGFLFSAGPGQPFELYDPQHASNFSTAAHAPIHAPACGVAQYRGLTVTPVFPHVSPGSPPHVEAQPLNQGLESSLTPPATIASPVPSPQLGHVNLPFHQPMPPTFGFGGAQEPQAEPAPYRLSGPTRFQMPPVPELQSEFDASRYFDMPTETSNDKKMTIDSDDDGSFQLSGDEGDGGMYIDQRGNRHKSQRHSISSVPTTVDDEDEESNVRGGPRPGTIKAKSRELATVVEAAQDALKWSTDLRVRRSLNRPEPEPDHASTSRSPTSDHVRHVFESTADVVGCGTSTGMPASRRRGN